MSSKEIYKTLYKASRESAMAGQEAGRSGDRSEWRKCREKEAEIRSAILSDEEMFWWNRVVGHGLALGLFAGKPRPQAEEEAVSRAMRAACIIDGLFPHDSLGLGVARDLARDLLKRGIRPLTEEDAPDMHFLALL